MRACAATIRLHKPCSHMSNKHIISSARHFMASRSFRRNEFACAHRAAAPLFQYLPRFTLRSRLTGRVISRWVPHCLICVYSVTRENGHLPAPKLPLWRRCWMNWKIKSTCFSATLINSTCRTIAHVNRFELIGSDAVQKEAQATWKTSSRVCNEKS